MSTTIVDPPRPLSAGQRTALLHRMLVVRHLAERHAPVLGPNPGDAGVTFRVGEEATAAGVLAALGPGDAVLQSAGPRAFALARDDLRAHRTTVTVCLCEDDDADWPAAERGRLPMLCLRPEGAPGTAHAHPGESVDGLDVEAVLPHVCGSLRAIRAGAGPSLLDLRVDGTADPIETLVVRMFAAHQLDDNALLAIDAAALAQVTAALTAAGFPCAEVPAGQAMPKATPVPRMLRSS